MLGGEHSYYFDEHTEPTRDKSGTSEVTEATNSVTALQTSSDEESLSLESPSSDDTSSEPTESVEIFEVQPLSRASSGDVDEALWPSLDRPEEHLDDSDMYVHEAFTGGSTACQEEQRNPIPEELNQLNDFSEKSAQPESEREPVDRQTPNVYHDEAAAVGGTQPRTAASATPLQRPATLSTTVSRYSQQLHQLKTMGYTNEDELLGLLNYHRGNVERVLDAMQRIRILDDDDQEAPRRDREPLDPMGSTPEETFQRCSAAYDELLAMGYKDEDESLMTACLQFNGDLGTILDFLQERAQVDSSSWIDSLRD